jgi:catechol 2,3-dioxygenase-like lactoylglutathione lyase family enzyme
MTLAIQRLGHVALTAPDTAAATAFAIEKLGFLPAEGGRLAGHAGIDAFSLEYVQGDGHIAFVAPGRDEQLRTPAGHVIRLIDGPRCDLPVGHVAAVPESAPAPLCADHVGIVADDLDAEAAFFTETLGMLTSASVANGMRFLRFPGRYLHHQVVITRDEPYVQFTCKNLDSFYASAAALREHIEMGPLRHGPGHEVAFAVRDVAGNRIVYSVEQEIVLDDDHHVARTWSAEDPKVKDEWA